LNLERELYCPVSKFQILCFQSFEQVPALAHFSTVGIGSRAGRAGPRKLVNGSGFLLIKEASASYHTHRKLPRVLDRHTPRPGCEANRTISHPQPHCAVGNESNRRFNIRATLQGAQRPTRMRVPHRTITSCNETKDIATPHIQNSTGAVHIVIGRINVFKPAKTALIASNYGNPGRYHLYHRHNYCYNSWLDCPLCCPMQRTSLQW
jgi:hypothetical protein